MTPTSFKLGGNTWRVKLQKAIVVVTPAGEVQHLYGECNIDTYTIRIARTVEGKPCTPETMTQTFIHEFIHAALYTIGRRFDDEELVVGLENMVWQYLKTAKHSKAGAAERIQLDADRAKGTRAGRGSRRKA